MEVGPFVENSDDDVIKSEPECLYSGFLLPDLLRISTFLLSAGLKIL